MSPRADRVTIRDIAQAAGTSIGSVSVALRGAKGVSEETRHRILKIADELGYIPDRRARTLRQATNRLIGVIFSLEQTFHADLVESLYTKAAQLGYDLALSGTTQSRTSHEAIESLMRERVDAIIFLAQDIDSYPWLTSAPEVPVVAIGHHEASEGLVRVVTDDSIGMDQSFRHLDALGHTQVLYLDGGDHPAGRHRLEAARQAAADLNIKLQIQPSGSTEADGIGAGERLLRSRPLPTAILCFNDLNALGLLAYLESARITVPDQVSIIGYDDARIARLSLAQLTSVRQDRKALAVIAADEAVTCVEQGVPQGSPLKVAQPQLVIRRTTGPVERKTETLP